MKERSYQENPDNGTEHSQAAHNKIDVLNILSSALSTALDHLRTAPPPDLEQGVDFYTEVRRFEVGLTQRALIRTGGSQTRAASLLGLNTSTLNTKIKAYHIKWQSDA